VAATNTRSILNYLSEDEPFGLSSRITIRGEACIAIGLDNGNDGRRSPCSMTRARQSQFAFPPRTSLPRRSRVVRAK
jgi:hypothetical protein